MSELHILCSFCGKERDHVELMFEGGPKALHICSSCIEYGMKIIEERRKIPQLQQLSEAPVG